LVATIFLVVTATLGTGLQKLQVTSDNRIFYSDSNARYRTLVSFEQRYTENNNIWFIVQGKEKNEWLLATSIRWLHDNAWRIDNALRVDSVANYNAPEATNILDNESVLDRICPSSDECNLTRPWPVYEQPLVRRLVGEDKLTYSVLLTVSLSRDDNKAIEQLTYQARNLADDFREKYPELRIVFTGGIPMMSAFAEAAERDSSSLFPIAFAAMLGSCWLLLSSLRHTLILLYVGSTTAVGTLGLAGHLGWTFNTASSATGVLVFTIVIASAMHLIVSFRNDLQIYTARVAAQNALRVNITPMSIAAMTTGASLAALATVDAPPLRELGLLSAFGCIYGYLQTTGYVAGLLERSSTKHYPPVRAMRLSTALSEQKAQLSMIPLLLILTIAGVYGLTKTNLNDDYIGYFSEDFEFRRNADLASQLMSSPNHLELDIQTSGTVFDTSYLEYVEIIQDHLESYSIVSNSQSFNDILRQTAKVDSRAYESYSGEELRQLYFAYEMSLSDGQSATDFVAQDGSSSRISILLGLSDSTDIRSLISSVEEFTSAAPDGISVLVTGENAPVAYLTEMNARQMAIGIAGAIALSTAFILAWKRSAKLAIVSLVACTLPIAIGLGLWMLIANEIGLAVLVVISVTIGIVIDDAIHMIARFVSYREDSKKSKYEASANTVRTVGAAVATTTIATSAGFTALAFSGFGINSTLGICTVFVLLASLIVDLIAVPIALRH
jgi:predicted RND superfamily exporter protein